MRTFIHLLLFLIALPASAQTPTKAQAEAFLDAKDEPYTITIPEYAPKYSLFRNRKPGDIVVNGKEVYRIVKESSVMAYNAGYIFLDAKKLSEVQLRELTKTILQQYADGTSFEVLAQDYTMDKNPNSATFKFITGQAAATFEKAVHEHKKGEVFTVSTPENGWFHIVKKNEDNTTVMAVVVEYGFFE